MDSITVLPKRYPFLLVDRIDAVDAGKSTRGTQRVTGSAWAIGGLRSYARFNAMPLMLIVKARTQLCGVIGYFLGHTNAHVLSGALPGDVRSCSARFIVASVARLRSRRSQPLGPPIVARGRGQAGHRTGRTALSPVP